LKGFVIMPLTQADDEREGDYPNGDMEPDQDWSQWKPAKGFRLCGWYARSGERRTSLDHLHSLDHRPDAEDGRIKPVRQVKWLNDK
jgi:hypothetical protein